MHTQTKMRLACFLGVMIFFAPALVVCQSNAWEPIGPDGGGIAAIAQDPSNTNILYAATSELPCRVYRSSDHGQSWSNASSTSEYILDFLFDQTNPSVLRAYSTYTLYNSLNGGQSWTSTSLLPNTVFWKIAMDPTDPLIFHAVGAQTLPYWVPAYFKSTNGGTSWSRTVFASDTGEARAIAIDPANPRTIYAEGSIIKNGYYVPKIFKSTDGGATFVEKPSEQLSGGIGVIVLHPTIAGKIYLAGNAGVFVSLDGASTWAHAFGVYGIVGKIAINKETPDIVYAGSDVGLYRSTNGGTSWSNLTGDMNNGFGGMVVESGSTPCVFYANAAGVLRSLDGGSLWEACNTGISAAHIRALCIPATTPATLYAAFEYSTVYKTTGATNASVNWQQLKRFYTCKYICAIASPPGSPDKIYAGEGGQ